MSSDTPAWGQFRWGHSAWPDNPPTEFWRVDGAAVYNLVSETRTWQTLTLVFRVSETVLNERLAHLQETAEKFETITRSDGSFATLDRSASGGVVTLQPPGTRTPPRETRDWLVRSYAQRPLDQRVADFEVALSFVARESREPDYQTADEPRAADEWGFAFRSGRISTKRVQADVNKGTDTSADTVDVTLILDADQTKVLEESVTRQAAVSVREVPDGPNSVDDDSPGNANSVVVATPDGTDPIPDGEYAVRSWQTEWLTTRGYRVSMTLSPTDLARSGLGWGQWGHFQFGQL